MLFYEKVEEENLAQEGDKNNSRDNLEKAFKANMERLTWESIAGQEALYKNMLLKGGSLEESSMEVKDKPEVKEKQEKKDRHVEEVAKEPGKASTISSEKIPEQTSDKLPKRGFSQMETKPVLGVEGLSLEKEVKTVKRVRLTQSENGILMIVEKQEMEIDDMNCEQIEQSANMSGMKKNTESKPIALLPSTIKKGKEDREES